mgnify:CR=1 FL=1
MPDASLKQTLEKARALGIAAVPYVRGKPLADDFINAKAVMVGSYKALFNGHTHASGGAGAPNQQMTDDHMTTTVKGG